LSTIAKSHEPLYVEEARAYIAAFPKDSVPAAKLVYSTSLHEGLDFGLIGLSQVCTHLACKTSFCKSSGWFECFCHGGKFNGVGEKTGGPPPRGLDQVRLSLDERGSVVVHTGRTFDGRPVGKGVVHIGAIGPLCD
jgi:Rieske Fe-S protein